MQAKIMIAIETALEQPKSEGAALESLVLQLLEMVFDQDTARLYPNFKSGDPTTARLRDFAASLSPTETTSPIVFQSETGPYKVVAHENGDWIVFLWTPARDTDQGYCPAEYLRLLGGSTSNMESGIAAATLALSRLSSFEPVPDID